MHFHSIISEFSHSAADLSVNLGCCWNSKFNKQIKLNIDVCVTLIAPITMMGYCKCIRMNVRNCWTIELMLLIIWTADNLSSSSERDVYDNDDGTETLNTAPEIVRSENGQCLHSRIAGKLIFPGGV